MSLTKRLSLTPPPQPDLKHRVITCLNKLSDRDTLAVATTELESIALTLSPDTFSPFLTCLSTTSSSEKSPVRKQCVRLLGFLSATHGDALSPHLSKMLSAVLRRLRDPDSAVRSACVDTVSSMASQITKPPFSSFSKPLVEAILTEQDYNSQIGSALCLSAAIDAAPDPEPAQLQKLLPRFMKLIKADCFKAKPALLALIGSIASAGGVVNRSLNSLIPCLVDFLSSEDWTARKAAAEALRRLVVAERNHLTEFKSSCLVSLESRRFDKVKVVRETMNQTLELWKEIPGASAQSKSSSKDGVTGGYSAAVSRGPHNIDSGTPAQETLSTSILSPRDRLSATTTQSRSTPKSNYRKQSATVPRKMDFNEQSDGLLAGHSGKDLEDLGSNPHTNKGSHLPIKKNEQSDGKTDVAVSQSASSNVACKTDLRCQNFGILHSLDGGSCFALKTETEQIHSNKTHDGKLGKVGGGRFSARVVPFHEYVNPKLVLVDGNATEDLYANQKEVEDLSLIQKQLIQIENQQSSLLNLLQKFMGSSQSGMSSLETRVNGLEKALDEISYDLGLSTGRISNRDSAENTCCLLPGAEFLTPKFWRRTEGVYVKSSPNARCSFPYQDASVEMIMPGSPRGQQKSSGRIAVNTLRGSFKSSEGASESLSNARKKILQNGKMIQNCKAGRLDGGSFANCIQQQT